MFAFYVFLFSSEFAVFVLQSVVFCKLIWLAAVSVQLQPCNAINCYCYHYDAWRFIWLQIWCIYLHVMLLSKSTTVHWWQSFGIMFAEN